jgi:hypothetical protein
MEENVEVGWSCEDDDGKLALPNEENAGDLGVPGMEEDEIW